MTISGITESFDVPFYEGVGGVSSQVPYPWPISIGGRTFTLELRHYQWQLPDMVRQAIDFSARPGEQSFDTGGVWLRTSGDWSLGAGQEYEDADDSNARMFAESVGIDPWTKREIKLHHDIIVSWLSSSDTIRLLPLGDYLYRMELESQELKRTQDVSTGSVSWDVVTGTPAQDLVDITTDGELVYVAAGDGIYSHDPAGLTAAAFGGAASTTIANILRFANGWLLCGVANVLSSIDAAGALTEVLTHRVNGFIWSAIAGAPSGIYAGGQASDVAQIYHIGFDDATGGLAVPVHAGELPRGEQLRSMSYYGSVILLGTSKGLRVAQINGDVNASLDIGPLIETGSDVLCTFGDSKFVWFGWSNYSATHTGVGRANLAEFRSRQQPAYASDLMLRDAQGAVTDVCRYKGQTVFAVGGSGVYAEDLAAPSSAGGTIRLGKHEWGTFEPKTFLGVQLITEPLDGSVSVTITDDAGVVTTLGTLSQAGSTCMGQLIGAGQGALSTFFDVELTLLPNEDFTLSPVVRLVSARALPVPHQIQRWVLPIICKSTVIVGAGEDIEQPQDVASVREYFVALRRAGTSVIFQEGDARRTVIVRDVSFPDGQVDRWGPGRNGLQGILFVTVDSTEG